MKKGTKKISLIEAIAIAVGTMIGASIFSIFGVGAQLAGKGLPVSFVISGILSLMVAYSYSKLGSRIVSNAGPIAFIRHGIGDNIITGTLAILLWISYVISIALFAKGFSGYLLPLCHIKISTISTAISEITLIAFFTLLNCFGSKAVGKMEFFIVLIKISILMIFIIFGLINIKPSFLQQSFSPQHLYGILHASVIFFLSYMGFGLITNASENMDNPKKNVPIAIYSSIIFVMIIYVCVSFVAVGNLTISELIKAKDNALAIAAKPFLGNLGFILLSLGALFSIASALNATLYGGANVAYSFAKDGELPKIFERKIWVKSTEGLYITASLGTAFVLFFNISSIASMTSIVFTLIYIVVATAHYKLVDLCGGNKALIIFNIITLSCVFCILLYFQYTTNIKTFWGSILIITFAFLTEALYRFKQKRTFKKIIIHITK